MQIKHLPFSYHYKIARIDLDALLWIHFIFNNFPLRGRTSPFVFIMNKWQPLKSRPADIFTHHTVKIRDGAIFVGVRIEEHLSVGVDGYVSPRVFLVLAQEPGDGLHLWLGLGEGATVGVVTRVCGGAYFCERSKENVISAGLSVVFLSLYIGIQGRFYRMFFFFFFLLTHLTTLCQLYFKIS